MKRMKLKMIIALLFSFALWNTQAQGIRDAINKGKGIVNGQGSTALTNDEVIRGLKEALTTGAKKSSEAAAVEIGRAHV